MGERIVFLVDNLSAQKENLSSHHHPLKVRMWYIRNVICLKRELNGKSAAGKGKGQSFAASYFLHEGKRRRTMYNRLGMGLGRIYPALYI